MDIFKEGITLYEVMEYIDNYLIEAEEDHGNHMMKKREYADYFDKSIDELPNKKYKNKKSAKRADMVYNYKENEIKHKSGFTERNAYPLTRKVYTNNNPKAIDSKLTRMIGDNIDKSDEKSKKKLEYARKKLIYRLGEDPNNTEIFTHNRKGNTPNEDDIRIDTYKSGKQFDISKLLSSDDNGDKYELVHKTDNDNINKLKGHDKSTKFVHNSNANAEGQLHPDKRVYYQVKKKSDAYSKEQHHGGHGKHKYVLNDKKLKKFAFDPERGLNYAHMRYGPKGKGSEEAYDVYVPGDSQNVKQII